MKNTKKILAVILSALVIFSFVGCNNSGEKDNTTTTTEATTEEVTTEEATTEEITTEEATTEEATTKETETTAEPTTKETTETTTKKQETTTKAPVTTTKPVTTTNPVTTTKPVTTTEKTVTYVEKTETVYATTTVNIRKGPSTSTTIVGSLKKDNSITRIAKGDNGWSKVQYNGTVCYISSEYLTTTKPAVSTTTPTTTSPSTTKPQVTTTQPQTTVAANTPVAQTNGGIKLYPVTSSTAKQIQNNWVACELYDSYEGKSADGKTILVYVNGPNGWDGMDVDETAYDAYGKIRLCEYCGKELCMGNKPNTCRGNCAVVFN